MPRRRVVERRDVPPDPIYQSVLCQKFINSVMQDGKRSLAEKIFYNAMDIIKEKTGEDPIKVFRQAVENAKPLLEVKSRRVGGSTYQVPVEVNPRRRESLSIRWLIGFAEQRGEKTMYEKLAGEFMDAATNKGATIKKKEDTHRMAEANKAFAHYKW